MDKRKINVLIQPEWKDSFWLNNITAGLKEAAHRFGYLLNLTDADSQAAEYAEDPHPLIVGSNYEWLDINIERMIARRARPVLVNACMIPTHSVKCSGVVFGIEEAVAECLRYLRETSKQRTALLGANRLLVTDIIKSRAFDKDDVIYADGKIEDCIADFVKNYRKLGYDSAVCANDTAAICLENHLIRAGCRIPEDFAIIGIGNSYIGANLPLPLTSIDFDYTEMGEQAVRLYHILDSDRTNCRINLTLPCRLIKRATTGTGRETEKTSPGSDRHYHTTEGEVYFSGEDAKRIIELEAVLQSCSTTDREILFSLIRGESCEQIAQRLFFTSRAVRYRITNLTKRCGCENRAELMEYLNSAVGKDNIQAKITEECCK